MSQAIIAHYRQALSRNPSIGSVELLARYGGSRPLVSKARKQLGLAYRQPGARPAPLVVALPEYMRSPLSEIATATGADVSIADLVYAVLDDLIAEHQAGAP